MDHIPRVRDSELKTAHLTVPYLAGDSPWEYGSRMRGFDSFRAFPKKHGFSSLLDQGCSGNDLPVPSIGFLQAWLYFGLLAEAFGTPEMKFQPDHFIGKSGNEMVITTKELNRYIWYWAAAVAHGVRDEIDEHSANLDRCLELANAVVNGFYRRSSEPKGSEKVDSKWSTTNTVLFSIITLVDYLRRARIDINMYSFEVNLPPLVWDFPPLDRALAEAGWCAAEISRLNDQTDCSTRFYLAQVDRWAQGKDHSRCIAGQGCQAHQIDEPTYRTRHRPDCKGEMCWDMGPVVEDVVKILDEGGYPLVNLSDNSRDVEVHPAKQGEVYVTISHVWSDGLGNPHDNTLPHCQLAYIQNLVNALYADSPHPVRFWLDTLCIPVGDRHSPFRRIAINRMHETFRASDKTLALDNSLMAQRTDAEMDWVEMNMRIKYCPWVTRAWTLLEGRVGKELLFQFHDKAVSSNFVFDRSYAERNILAVSAMLEKRGVENVLSEPNALRLARALTLLPETLGSTAQVYDTWMPILQSAGVFSDLSDIDDDMSVNIQTRVFCPVTKHSNAGTRNIRDEFWLENIVSTREDAKAEGTQYAAYAFFEGVSLGFRGRTASKAEDETICFGQMLGIDTAPLTAIKPLRPRERYWLSLIDSNPLLSVLARAFGIDAGGRLAECQEKRIQTLLTHIERLPLTILLWEVSRMRSPGWKWAPLSLLDVRPGSEGEGTWASSERGIVGSDGLTVSLPALQLRTTDRTRAADVNVPLSHPIHLKVATEDDGIGPVGGGEVTFILQLDSKSIPPEWKRYKTWSAFIGAGVLDSLCILTRRRASIHDPFKNRGVLVEVCGRERRVGSAGEAMMAQYRVVVERPHEGEMAGAKLPVPVVCVGGRWDMQSRWCIG
ncbi:uncharacterized protein DSM5745_04842 [Aspergillus mulundensis]|uniref:Heterokaryon incompatibility domain-containing protein n=1 Tax=Aspergillus mulundensis TaxID=1810919 RepID=A0A3D8S4S6_9EURO|nr:Uncharacterized protein DSM5745_04842 [Aspergillus mulundensis]RDW81285.1 Uncharacterized protein DSM5745_04842 [Aspergillus mulundensis]